MSSNGNSTDNGNNGGGGGGGDSGTILAIVALVVSIVALIGTVLQVLQQYLASAAGYSNCGSTVIGEWHVTKRRKFRLGELRFEVLFETPVIFVCPATNKRGPIRGAEVWHINGTPASLRQTRTKLLTAAEEQQEQSAASEKSVHTADNEQSTWVTLLQELHRMERDSQEWQEAQYKNNPPRAEFCTFEQHSLCAAVQAKKRSWDTMPPNITKPYATTAMCHIIEMAAMLGIYWKEFDRSKNKFRAEGNGYVLTGSNVSDLGIMFTFQLSGKSQFKDNRIVPSDDIKELAFGFASTIFRDRQDNRRLVFPTEEPRDLGLLQLGSANEFAETLVSFGCTTATSNTLRDKDKKHGHLFPLAFEILGMLGRTVQVRNSCFRLLPNPTFYHWDKRYFSMRKLLHEFRKKIMDDDLVRISSGQIGRIQNLSEKIDGRLLDQTAKSGENGISLGLLDALHEALGMCDKYLRDSVPRTVVELVLREHIQEVLRMINEDEDEDGKEAGSENGDDGRSDATRHRAPHFNDLMTASPEEKQEMFMDIYFAVLLPRVIEQTTQSLRRVKTSSTYGIHSHHGSQPTNAATLDPMSPVSRPITPLPPDSAAEDEHPSRPGPLLKTNTGINEKHATNVWCTLVFRMLCWLLLHDFNRVDVQISKSELLGSRLPVYIS